MMTGLPRHFYLPALLVGLLACSFSASSVAREGAPDAGRCVVRDPHFQRGVKVYDPKEGGGHKQIGILQGLQANSAPVWGLSQWNTSSPFKGEPSASEQDPRFIQYSSGSKTVTFGRDGTLYADVALKLNSAIEYKDTRGVRPAKARWPALYLWQSLDESKPVAQLKQVNFSADAKLNLNRSLRPSGPFNPREDAAQFTMFLTIQNMNKQSPDFGKYVWFGLPIYDNRYKMSAQHQQKDAFTKKFIYLLDSRSFSKNSMFNEKWNHLSADLLPEIKESLSRAKAKGFFQDPLDLSSFYIRSLNVGWEIPGTFESEVQLKDFNVCLE
jgi:hypothetical protein